MRYALKTTLPTGIYTFRFSVWNSAISNEASEKVREETRSEFKFRDSEIEYFFGSDQDEYRLWVQVDRKTPQGFEPMGPREPLGGVPYAFWNEMLSLRPPRGEREAMVTMDRQVGPWEGSAL